MKTDVGTKMNAATGRGPGMIPGPLPVAVSVNRRKDQSIGCP